MPGFSVRGVLTFAGRHGPAILCGGVLIGIALPSLASVAKPLMGAAVFLFTLGAFLKVDWPTFQREVLGEPVRVGLVILWSLLGVPLTMLLLLVTVAPVDGELREGLLLNMLAPPVGSAAAIAAMLGLSAPLALLTTVVATVASPLLLPPLSAALTGQALSIDPLGMGLRLLLIVGGACITAAALRRWCGGFVRANPHAMTGLAVVGLIVVAIGAMHGMRDVVLAQPGRVALFLLLAFAVNIAFQVAGTLLFWPSLGRVQALTVGLVSGNRNVTLIWAAAGPSLIASPGVELYLAMSVFPIFMLPLVSQTLIPAVLNLRLLGRQSPVQGAQVQRLSPSTASDVEAAKVLP